LRTGYLSQNLADRGHEVTWWTSAFDHSRKRKIAIQAESVRVNDRLTLRLLDGGGYQSNVSIRRIRDHRRLAGLLDAGLRREPLPDIIVCSLPPIELAFSAVQFGIERNVPTVLDMRDMWPDIFVDEFPRGTRGLAKLLLKPFFRQAEQACRGATAITGITEEFVAWGLQRGKRERTARDCAFPMGYRATAVSLEKLRDAVRFWKALGVQPNPAVPIFCFFGNMGRIFDLDTVIRAAAIVAERGRDVRFVLCGSGERFSEYQTLAARQKNVVLPGWVDEAKIQVLLGWAYAGLDPLPERYDFLATINNKAIEYLSAGVPILSSPARGLLAETLTRHECGASCPANDPFALAELVWRAMENPSAWETKANNARLFFDTQLDAQKVYSKFSNLLESIVRGTVEPVQDRA
jgi:glycosyltransferase involved in cell wall biosynthesis